MEKVNIQCLYKIFEHSPVGIIIWCFHNPSDAANAQLKYCNKAAEINTGYLKLRTYIGRTLKEVFPDAVDAEVTKTFVRALETGLVHHLGEYRYGDKNIPESHFDVTVQALNHHLVMVSHFNLAQQNSLVWQRKNNSSRNNYGLIIEEASILD